MEEGGISRSGLIPKWVTREAEANRKELKFFTKFNKPEFFLRGRRAERERTNAGKRAREGGREKERSSEIIQGSSSLVLTKGN